MARVEIGDVLAIGVVHLISGPVPDDPQPEDTDDPDGASHRSSPNFR